VNNDIFAANRDAVNKTQRYVRDIFTYFERLYAANSKWWHAFSPYHIAVKHEFFKRWSEIVLDLSHMRNYAQINAELDAWSTGLTLELAKFQDRYDKPDKNISTVSKADLVVMRKIWGTRDEKDYRKIIFNILSSGSVKDQSYTRVLLYVMIGCTPAMLEDYKEVPTSFLMETARTLGNISD